jgi:nucleoside-diphosphate-sugar epimerase
MNDNAADPLTAFRAVNVDGTLNLARQAAAAGVKRFVFISSVKVNGESMLPGRSFIEADTPNPQAAHGQSKHEAEQGLRQLAAETGMETVIIRPPLVYGPGVKTNFAALTRAVQRGWPLPLGAVHNQRSLVALDNLVNFIVICITHPQAANQIFLVSDGETCPPPSWCAAWRKQLGRLRVCCRCQCGLYTRGQRYWARVMRYSACAVICRLTSPRHAVCWVGCRRCLWKKG